MQHEAAEQERRRQEEEDRLEEERKRLEFLALSDREKVSSVCHCSLLNFVICTINLQRYTKEDLERGFAERLSST